MNIDRLAQYYHNPAEMANHPLSELEELVQEYPFFTAGHLLLLKQYMIHNSSRYKKQHRKMLALSPDPVRTFLFTEGEAWIVPDLLRESLAGEVAAGEVAAEEVLAGEAAAGEAAAEEVAAGEVAAGEVAAGEVASSDILSDAASEEDLESNNPQLDLVRNQKETVDPEFLHKSHEIQDWFRYFSAASQYGKVQETSEQIESDYERGLQLAASADLLKAPSGPLMATGLDALRVKLNDEQAEPLSVDSMHTIRILAQASIDDGQLPASETLAEIFASQQEWDHAIAIYEQLILMNPEKITIFAPRLAQLKQAKG